MESTLGVSANSRLRALDGVRGVALLLVVVPHLAVLGIMSGPAMVKSATFSLGHGVEIFFVLSGFCLALPILSAVESGSRATLDLGVYLFNRFFRVVPLYALAFGLCLALDVALMRVVHRLPATTAWDPRTWPAQLFFFDRDVQPINASFWSIPVQLRWYLAFPMLLALYVRSRRAFVTLLVATIVAYEGTRLHTIDVGTLPLFLLGIIAAGMFVRDDARRRYAIWLVPIGVLLGHLMDRYAWAPDPFGRDTHWAMQPTTLGWQIAAFGFVLAATSDRRLVRVLSLPPLSWLGTASFSIYLLHYPIQETVAMFHPPAAGPIAFAASLAAGAALWFFVERRIVAPAVRRAVRRRALPLVRSLLRFVGVGPELVLTVPHAAPAPEPVVVVPVSVAPTTVPAPATA